LIGTSNSTGESTPVKDGGRIDQFFVGAVRKQQTGVTNRPRSRFA